MNSRVGDVTRTLTVSGLWVAGIGFFVTRFTVTLAAYETRTQFLLSGVLPLVIGLLLATFGVALAVGSFDPDFVRTVAIWCTASTLAMATLLVLTLVGTAPGGLGEGVPIPSGTILSNFLIGGAGLGALTGIYAGLNRRNRAELRRQADRLVTINRILRHEVLNAVAVISGQAEYLERGKAAPQDVPARANGGTVRHIREETGRIVDSIENVKHLARTARSATDGLSPVDLGAAVDDGLRIARDRYPDVEFSFDGGGTMDVRVWADSQLNHAIYPLIENAALYNDSASPVVNVEVTGGKDVASVRIADCGAGLPAEHRATLERGEIPDYDDPTAGFGTNVARMFVEGYGGDIRTDVTDEGTTVEVVLPLAAGDRPSRTYPGSFGAVGVDRSGLLVATGAAIVAGGVMGLYMQSTAGVIPIIGALYGVPDPLVGWITHEFHSVVFGLIFVGLLTLLPRSGERLVGRLGVGVAWGLFLWLVAAGLVMPVWLNLVGIPTSLPSVSVTSLNGHLLWGVSLSAMYHVVTRLSGRHDR